MVESQVKNKSRKETILLVVKDDIFRSLSRRILERKGYSVIVAANSEEAEKVFKEYKGNIDLLLTDAVLPDFNGKILYMYLTLLQPNLRVLYISGYFDIVLYRQGVIAPDDPFLEKPFTPITLMKKIREIIDKSSDN